VTKAELEALVAIQPNDILLWGSEYFRVDHTRAVTLRDGVPRVLVGRLWLPDSQEWGDLGSRRVVLDVPHERIQVLDDEHRKLCGFEPRDGRDWHMLDQLPSPGVVPNNLDPTTKVYVLRREQYPVDDKTGNPLKGDFAQYGLYEVGERLPDGSVREHEREEWTEWTYTSREGNQHDQIEAQVTEWASALFGRPMEPRHNGHGDWELELGPSSSAARDAGAPAARAGGGATTYQEAVKVLIGAADRSNAFCRELQDFADTLEGKGWGEEVTGPLDDQNARLMALEGEYRHLAAGMKRQGDRGAAAREAAPYVPEVQAL
jgi:hypothetical protein